MAHVRTQEESIRAITILAFTQRPGDGGTETVKTSFDGSVIICRHRLTWHVWVGSRLGEGGGAKMGIGAEVSGSSISQFTYYFVVLLEIPGSEDRQTVVFLCTPV